MAMIRPAVIDECEKEVQLKWGQSRQEREKAVLNTYA